VVLKLKTSDFQSLTRSLTPAIAPASARELADIAWELRHRVTLAPRTRYRLAGVGLSGFIDRDLLQPQAELFSEDGT
jgi:DNA polymerase-4